MIESRSPQAPDDVVVSARVADAAAVGRACASAREAARPWAAASAVERAGALTAIAESVAAAADELAALMVREVGKPITEARGEVARSIAILRFHAQAALLPDGESHPTIPPRHPDTVTFSRRRPHGVAGLLTPWNFPLAIPLWKAAPALAYGNAVVLKPSPAATATALRLAEIASEHLPAGVLQVLPGEAEAGRALVENVDAVSFTGSTAVGTAVARQAVEHGTPVQCEMGGSNASIVLPDADPEAVAATIAAAAMGFAGQKCTATSRIIVVGDAAPFTDALLAAVRSLPVGDPGETSTVVGPVIDRSARDRVVETARESGRILAGGDPIDAAGHFAAPTLVDRLDPAAARLAREEVFGPIAAILTAASNDEARAISDAASQRLVTSVFTEDLTAALWFTRHLRSGLIYVNQPTTGVDFHAPFGGEGASSIGPREQGLQARDFYTTTHTIGIAPALR